MDNPLRDPTLAVPVLVDDSGRESATATQSTSTVSLVRCVYFTFDASQPSPNWNLWFGTQSMPFFMLGLSGIIFRTVEALGAPSPEFLSPSDIDRTFEFVEQSRQMLIETGRIYLPQRFFKDMKLREPQDHDVLRVRGDVFVDAYAFAQGRMTDRDFARRLSSFITQQSDPAAIGAPVQYSPEETRAFRTWAEKELRSAQVQERNWASDLELHPEEDRSRKPF